MAPQQPQQDSSSLSPPALEEPLLSGPENPSSSSSPSTNDSSTRNSSSNSNKDVILPSCCCLRQEQGNWRMNHNVFLNLLLTILYGISGSLSTGSALAAYIQVLSGGKNGPFGDIEAVFGLSTLFTALPIGYLADRYGRSKVIRVGGILLILSTIGEACLLWWIGTDLNDVHREKVGLALFGVLCVMFGISEGIVDGPCSALFADSTPAGERSKYYNYLFVAYSGATAVGPLVSIILFQILGDNWSFKDLQIVIYVGLGMEFFNAFLMLLFDDRKALDESSSDSDDDSSEGSDGGLYDDIGSSENANEEGTTTTNQPQPHQLTTLQQRQKWIPYIIFTQDLVSAVGSGMTIKFFPLFFKDEVGMTPSQVQTIFCITPIVMGIISTLGSKLASNGFGRVQTQLLFSTLGVSCLYCMVFFKNTLDVHPALLVPIYILRTGLMNGSSPLQESILMDFVPKGVRARWKSLDSVASFGWCGSAAFGGWLADKYDYTYSFLITAILQSLGIVIWATLLPLVPKIEGNTDDDIVEDENRDSSEIEDEGGAIEASRSLQEPLLSSSEDQT